MTLLLRLNFVLLIVFHLICDAKAIVTEGNDKNPNCPSIKLKRQWGGKFSRVIKHRPVAVKYVVIHHTVTKECTNFLQCADILQNMQHHHLTTLDLNDIGYNFLIGNDGIVYEGTGWYIKGAFTHGYNENGIGIAFIGDFRKKLPSRKALRSAKRLLSCGTEIGVLDPNYELFGAMQLSATKSPGLMLYNEIQDWNHWSPHPPRRISRNDLHYRP
uniref:Peptidoglycan-recognition protein n=1 Tax=Stomoxys calcitrans TaxID=35570 RepID=A0A1I8Q9Z5_STOCA